jgi:hypothetical protein
MSRVSSRAVRISTGIRSPRRRSSRSTLRPSMSGSPRSSIARSKSSSEAIAVADAPSFTTFVA